MNNEDSKGNDEEEKLRKLLRELPEVPAREGFEARLHRRLAGPRRRGGFARLFESILSARRIPVFAYSVLALAAIGVLSYYLSVRPGAVTPIVPPATPAARDTASTTQPETVLKREAPMPVKSKAAENRRKDQATPPAGMSGAPAEVSTKELQPESQLRQQPAQMQESNEQGALKPLQKGDEKMITPSVQPSPEKKTAPSVQAIQGKSITVPQGALQNMAGQRSALSANRAQFLLDSVARTDSLKQDSLRRLQKKLPTPRPKERP